MTRLATGKRLNGQWITLNFNAQTRLNSEIRGPAQAAKNAGVGVAINDTADEALSEIVDTLQNMRDLAVEAASDSTTDVTRNTLNTKLLHCMGLLLRYPQTLSTTIKLY